MATDLLQPGRRAKSRFRRFQEWFAASRIGSWFVRTVLRRLDPLVFRATGGRYTAGGPAVIPHLLLTTTGRKSGHEREAQLVYTEIAGANYVVASNFGGPKHPAWSHNLDANPSAIVQIGSERIPVQAVRLAADEVTAVWQALTANIPMYATYRTRTARDIKVYRLEPAR